ncbi:MAG: hypothetical protein M3332_14845 [Actinomycetota bacterium]|nr:hypothetical protein [Actinomycetota bacterium]
MHHGGDVVRPAFGWAIRSVTAFAGDLIATYVSALAPEAGTWAGDAPEAAAIAKRTQQIRDYFAALPADSFPTSWRSPTAH